ncbi:MAG: invasion associated locus B family protein [Pseudomonadota bacterium]|nr:invasion associated locus B family protein [Pseudomonadota bacterium]
MKKITKIIYNFLFLLIAINFNFPVVAKEAKNLGVFGSWEAFSELNGKNLFCYIGAYPQRSHGNYKKRGESYMLITHRPAEKSFGEVSIKAGYQYLKASEVAVVIEKNAFNLFTDAGHAFTHNKKTDIALIEAMKRGKQMIVKGISSRKTKTTDTYSLKGFSAAWKTINKACKYK